MNRIIKIALYPGINKIQYSSHVELVHLDSQNDKFYGWFVEFGDEKFAPFEVFLAMTGQELPEGFYPIRSHQVKNGDNYFMLHACIKCLLLEDMYD